MNPIVSETTCPTACPGLLLRPMQTSCAPSEPDPEKGLNVSQASLRIVLLALAFIVVAIFKLEINLENLFQKAVAAKTSFKVAEDEDFELFFKVRVSFANLRDKPSTKKGKVLFVPTQGAQFEVMEKKGK